jgi:hypothetical protein
MTIEMMPDRGQEDDVDLGVAEPPEDVLPQLRVAPRVRSVERPAELAVELEHEAAADERREREDDHDGGHELRPHEQRHPRQRHARVHGT